MRLSSEHSKKVCLGWAARLLLVLLCIATAWPQDVADPPVPSAVPSTRHSLSGTVVNSVTGEPVRRALVQAGSSVGGNQFSALTDAEGRFEFAAMPESDVVLTARKPGFFSDLELHPEDFHYDMIHLGSDTSSVVLKLLPEGMVFGHVMTLKGEPVEDSQVRILQEKIVDGRKRWEMRGQATTDEDGQFRVGDLVPGQYVLAVGPNLAGARMSFGQVHSNRSEGFGTMFYPGVPELEAATPVAIGGGQQVQADFAIKPEPIFSVSGTVVGVSEGVHAGMQIRSQTGETYPAPFNFSWDTGKFEVKVPGGEYVLEARAQDSSGLLLRADLPIHVNRDMEGISMPLSPTLTLAINVDLHASTTTEAPVQVNRLPLTAQALSSARLIPRARRIEVEEFQAERNEKTQGLEFRNLTPGHYSVEITAVPPWHVQSLTSGATDLLREDLVIVAGRRPNPLEVVLRDDGAGLQGTIRAEGQPSGGAVLLFSERMSLEHAQMAVAQNGAQFLFTGLAPGEYKVLAFDSLEGLEFRNPEALSPYLSRALGVSLQANEVGNLNIELIRREK